LMSACKTNKQEDKQNLFLKVWQKIFDKK